MSVAADIYGDAAGALVDASGTVRQLKINLPNVRCDDGAKCSFRAVCRAVVSPMAARPAASVLFSDGSKTAETTLPAESTSACTTLGAITSLHGSDGRLVSPSSRRRARSPTICSLEFCASTGSTGGVLNFGCGLKSFV